MVLMRKSLLFFLQLGIRLRVLTLLVLGRFVGHPWFNITSDFINLEGAGSGG